jgi:hypothetical protein
MSRKNTRSSSGLCGIAPFIGVLSIMIALAARAQTGEAGQPLGESSSFSLRPSPNVRAVLAAQTRPLQWGGGDADRALMSPPWTTRSGERRMDANPYGFVSPVVYNIGDSMGKSIAIADLNGDGKPDLVVAGCSLFHSSCEDGESGVGVLLGNGDGTFQAAVTYVSGGLIATSVAVADVNGDGKPDVLVSKRL